MNITPEIREHYRSYGGIPPWLAPTTSGFFQPSPAGRTVVQLSPIATLGIMTHHLPMNSKKGHFLLLKPEGDLRGYPQEEHELTGEPSFLVHTLARAAIVALDEQCLIYNARSKKSFRPVWGVEPQLRTPQNMVFEPVRLIPHMPTIDRNMKNFAPNVRFFAIESGREDLDRKIKNRRA